MMIWPILRFELWKRFRQLSTYVYFFLFLSISFTVIIAAGGAFPGADLAIGGSGGRTFINSPQLLAILISLISYFGLTIMAAVMGQAIYQDFHYQTHTLFFTTPIHKRDYLIGRFVGGFIVLCFIFSSVALGCWLGSVMPFVDRELFGPNRLHSYLRPYLFVVLPNMLFIGAIFFSLAAITRKILPVYVASVVLLIGYLIATVMSGDVESKYRAAMLDPFGLTAIGFETEYWTVAERNARPIPLVGALLWNRLLWMSVAALVCGATMWRFRFQYGGEGARRVLRDSMEESLAPVAIPACPPRDFGALRLLPGVAWLNFTETVRNVYFAVIVLAGVLFMVLASQSMGAVFGTETHPVTGAIVSIVGGSFSLFVLIIITFYSGEMVWRERDANVHQLNDVMPTPNWLPLTSKIIALALVQVLLLVVVVASGALIQASQGYFRFEWDVYLRSLFGISLIDYVLLCVLAIAVHVVVNHKYAGHFVMVLYYLATAFMGRFGLDHHLYDYGGHPGHPYSDMNRFGHFVYGVAWFQLYWALIALLLALFSNLLWVRGVEQDWKHRLRTARRRCSPRLLTATALTALSALGVGGFIYYSTVVLNRFTTTHQRQRDTAEYEQQYKSIAEVGQPRITAVQAHFDLYPNQRDLRIDGVQTLLNKTTEPIPRVYVNIPIEAEIERLALGPLNEPSGADLVHGLYWFDLAEPLAPGVEAPLTFKLNYVARGFRNDASDQDVVYNGTFVNSSRLPSLGYVERRELSGERDRRKFGLPPKERMPDVHDLAARRDNYITYDSDWISLDVTVSTAEDQIAIVPGYLQREWTEKGRRHFHYKTEGAILNFFSVLSARYAVKRDSWTGPVAFGKTNSATPANANGPLQSGDQTVSLEIYYHPGHEYNLDGMMEALKASLDYCARNFSPYQHRQLRIIEFPGYSSFAQSFPNTIPYSEAIGFVAKVDPNDEKDIDYPYYVTAHEVAHQWWAHQVIGGNVRGATVMSETLSQYAALMVLKHKYGDDYMKRFLRYELDNYLMGRGVERKKELPLAFNENQGYIHYNKGSLVMYALQDYVGEDVVNRALANYIRDVAYQEPPYTTSLELMAHLRAEIPSEYQYLIEDMFETITLFNNRAVSATSKPLPSGGYQVTINVSAEKVRADDQGEETTIPIDDIIEIGVLDEKGKAMAIEKHRVNQATASFSLTVDQPPAKAGIDPLNKLIDRNPGDNVIRVREAAN